MLLSARKLRHSFRWDSNLEGLSGGRAAGAGRGWCHGRRRDGTIERVLRTLKERVANVRCGNEVHRMFPARSAYRRAPRD